MRGIRHGRTQSVWGLGVPVGLILLGLVAWEPPAAYGVILGGTGNEPINNPGWPRGAAEVFNAPQRVAYWEGPPLGGGEWHAEYQGDAPALQRVLELFARIDAPVRRLVVHDGAGHSFWLDPNRQKVGDPEVELDWTFTVWVPAVWDRLHELPADLRPREDGGSHGPPAPQIDVFVGAGLRWEEIEVPDGMTVVDERLEAHGFDPSDGSVLEGTVVDLTTGEPVAASVHLERMERAEEGVPFAPSASTQADRQGHWVLQGAAAGRYRLVIQAPGYARRVVGYPSLDEQPRWAPYDSGLATAVAVAGQVVDEQGKPLAGVDVRLADVVGPDGRAYDSPDGYTYTTDREGNFRADVVPQGEATVRLHKSGYCVPGLGSAIATPAHDLRLTMIRAGTLVISVEFGDNERPEGYIVEVQPEGGAAIGRWSASSNLGQEGTVRLPDVPPGRYAVTGRPNPGSESERTEPVTIVVQGGRTTRVALKAR